ncbi:peptidase M4 [Gammaproteobacteria bacterium]|nr:peptidase M4 [Gammaproteobacteria bacterium]
MINSPVRAGDDISQNEIRELVKRGELLPLESILALYPEKQYGKLLDLEAEREHGTIIYELKTLRADGRVTELKIDARNGSLLELEVED